MEGEIRVSLEREPDASFAASIEGHRHRTIVARVSSDLDLGTLAGMGSRSVGWAFVNGEPRLLGYLSQLRVDSSHRGRAALLRAGYERIRSFRAPDELPFDVTTMISDNRIARRLLGAGLPGFPAYREIGEMTTLVLPSSRRWRGKTSGVCIERGSAARLPEIAACLERNAQRAQFAPRFSVEDLSSPERSRGLAAEDFFVALAGGEVAGCLALWDQSAYKQVVVRGYGPRLTRWRPWLNRLSPVFGTPRLPEPGENLPHAYLAHLAVDGDDVAIFRALVQAALAEARARRYIYTVLGLASIHPFLSGLLRRLPAREYRSTIYAVSWEDGAAAVASLDARRPHLEVARL